MTEPRDTPNPATSTRPGRSSAKVGEAGGNKLVPILLGLLLLLVLIGLLLYFLLRGGNDDNGAATPAVTPSVSTSQTPTPSNTLSPSAEPPASSSAPTTTPSASTPATTPSATAPATTPPAGGAAGGAAAGTLLSGSQDVVAAAGSSTLAPLVGKPVAGTAVVQEVVADEGFWVGSSPEQRAFVYLTKAARGGGESGPKVKAGDTVTLTGTVGALADNAPAVAGVTGAEGKAQLARQGALVLATTYALS